MASKELHPHRWDYIQPIISHPVVKSSAPYIFSLLAVIFFTLFVFRSTLFTITQLQSEIDSKTKTSGDLDKKIQILQAAKSNLDSMTDETRAKIDRAVPLQADVVNLISDIEESANATNSGLSIEEKTATVSGIALQIQSTPLLSGAPLVYPFTTSAVDFTYNIKGNYGDLLNVIERLKKSARLFRLVSISINTNEEQEIRPGEQAQQVPPLTLSVDGEGYFLSHQQ